MKNTFFSVVIPTRNRPAQLEKALQSVFAQTMNPKEVIVVDDGSQPPVSKHIFNQAPREIGTVLLRNDPPLGAAGARNVAVSVAKSPWIAFLDDDDQFFPEKLQTIAEAMVNNPEADLFYHPAKIHLVRERIQYISGASEPGSHKDLASNLLVKNFVGGSSMVVINKKSLIEAGGFDNKLSPVEDWELWIRLAFQKNNFCFLSNPLTLYFHDNLIPSLTKDTAKAKQAYDRLREKHEPSYARLSGKGHRRLEANKHKSMVLTALLNNDIRGAVKEQVKLILTSRKFRDFIALFIIPLGPKVVFKLRSML